MISFEDQCPSTTATELYAVEDFNLEVTTGSSASWWGRPGGGKTTILRMVNRMVEPSSGRIVIDGHDIAKVDPVELRRRTGYVIQQSGLFPHLKVADNVACGARACWVGTVPGSSSRVDEMLDLVGLDPATYAGRYPNELSGGPGPARRRGPGSRRGPSGAAHGRTFRRRRPHRSEAGSSRSSSRLQHQAPKDGHVRDPRRRRGGEDGRPDRRPEPRVAYSSSTTPRPRCWATPLQRSWRTSSGRTEVSAAWRLHRSKSTICTVPRWSRQMRRSPRRVPPWPVRGRTGPRSGRRRPTTWLGRARADDRGPDATGGSSTVAKYMRPLDARVSLDASLKTAFAEMLQHDAAWVAVLDKDHYLGVLTPDNLWAALRRSVGGEPVTV